MAVQNRPAVLIETHMLKPYKIRVESTQELIKLTMELLNKDHQNFKKLIDEADNQTQTTHLLQQPLTRITKPILPIVRSLNLRGWNTASLKVILLVAIGFSTAKEPANFQIELFTKNIPSEIAQLPLAYIFPPNGNLLLKNSIFTEYIISKLKNPKIFR